MSANRLIVAKKPTILIQTDEKFLYSMMRFVDIVDLNSVVELYSTLFKEKKEVLNEDTFIYKNTLVTYVYKDNTLTLKNIEQYYPNENSLNIKCSEHFVAKLIRKKTSISSFIPAYFYALTKMSNEKELLKKELTIGNETIVFSLKGNILELITGWTGNRKKRIFNVF